VIHRSPFPDQPIPNQALTEFVFEAVEQRVDKPALIEGPTGRVVTYGALFDAVRQLGGGLASMGFGPGHVMAIMAPNMPEYAAIFHGAAMAGGTVTTINPTYTAHEVHHQLLDSGAEILVTTSMFLDTARQGAIGTAVDTIAIVDDGTDGVPTLADLMSEPLVDQVPVDLDAVVAIPYSSGTTGLSKGVMLTHRNLVSNIVQTAAPVDLGPSETVIAVLPFFHIYGMQVLMNVGLRVGATIVTMPRFDFEEFLQLHQDHGAVRAFVAPPMVLALARHPVVEKYDLSKLTWINSGAAPLSAELALEASERIGCEVIQGFGMTELSPVSHLTPPGDWKPGSVGVTAPNTETMIVDPASGEPLGIDADGEVWVRGPQVMKGYLNNPSATSATITADGWLRTGDIGHIDLDGHLFVVDRLKELIKYKGFQVPPAELEALLLTHPAVADAAVVGLPDVEAGEIPVGFVVITPGQEATEGSIIGFIAAQVATYKQIRRVIFIDQIPKSASGKILRRVLRDDAANAG
jgi:4-coumarate--CoA ligase